jgi:predicted patatin/cPLA2 family phospholipase
MPKRSLMLAGGGVKIASQAGVLQAWLDEAGLELDHADGVSAACFNTATWAQGMSGRQSADNWRNLEPLGGVDVNWSQLARLVYAESLFELDACRRKVFPSRPSTSRRFAPADEKPPSTSTILRSTSRGPSRRPR